MALGDSDSEQELASILEEALTSHWKGQTPDPSQWEKHLSQPVADLPGLVQTVCDIDEALQNWCFPVPTQETAYYPSRDIIEEKARPPKRQVWQPSYVGRYRILEEVGAGGMGQVYKAYDSQLERVVAVKVPHADLIGHDSQWAKRFLQEARIAAKIRHPHVCPIHDVGEHEGRPFVVMAYVDGPSLSTHLRKHNGLVEPLEAVRLVRQVAEALGAVHACGIIHRDLKPANILLDKGGQAILTDFGLARPQTGSDLTVSNLLLGTPAYMAPEQAAGHTEQLGPWSDLYSLGVVFYRVLTGRMPFTGNDVAVLWKIGREKPTPLSQARPGLDPALEAIVLKAMALRPEQRFQSAREMMEALDFWLIAAEKARGSQATPSPTPVAEGPRTGVETRVNSAPEAAVVNVPPGAPSAPLREIAKLDKAKLARKKIAAWIGLLGLAAACVVSINLVPPENDLGKDGKEEKPAGKSSGLIPAEPITFSPGAPLSPSALVVRPAPIPGLQSWTVETREHRGPIHAIACRPNGEIVALAGQDGTIRLWQADGKKLVRLFLGHAGPVHGLAWSPCGVYLASAGEDQSVRLWDAESGKTLRILRGHQGPVRAVAWSADPRILASADTDGRVFVWDVTQFTEPRLHKHDGQVSVLAWSRGGKKLACAGHSLLIRLWDLEGGQETILKGHQIPLVQGLAWSPDGKTLASAGQDATLRLWDSNHALEVKKFNIRLPGLGLAWSPDGARLATVSGKGLELWTTSGMPSGVLARPSDLSQVVSWSTDGNHLVSAHASGAVVLWDANKREKIAILEGHPHGAAALAFCQDNKTLAVSGFSDTTVRFWQTESGRFQSVPKLAGSWGRIFAWSPEGKFLAAGDESGSVRLWDVTAQKWLDPLVGHKREVLCLAWSLDGKILASGSVDGTALIWERKPPAVAGKSVLGVGEAIWHIAWSPDGNLLACGAGSQIHVCEVHAKTPPRIFKGHLGQVEALAWPAHGKFLASGDREGRLTFFLTETGEVQRSLWSKSPRVQALAWSSDGLVLASAGSDGIVRLWKGSSGESLGTLEGHRGAVLALAWLGRNQVASAGEDGTIRVFDAEGARPQAILVPLRGGNGLVLAADGKIVSPGSLGEHLNPVVRTEADQKTITAAEFFSQRFTPPKPQ